MCPLRVVVILLSLLIAIIAALLALAEPVDPEIKKKQDEELEKTMPASFIGRCWWHVLDFASGRFLYRHLKLWFPSYFASSNESDAMIDALLQQQKKTAELTDNCTEEQILTPSQTELAQLQHKSTTHANIVS